MFVKSRMRAKLFLAHAKRVSFVLFVWSLGIVSGVSSVYSLESFSELKNEPVGGFHEIVIHNVSANVEIPSEDVSTVETWSPGEFTAYTASENETDSSPSIMASGKKVYSGAIACPSFLELGSKVEIKGKGVFTCEDRMNARYRDSAHFDIFTNSKAEALQFGRKQLKWRSI